MQFIGWKTKAHGVIRGFTVGDSGEHGAGNQTKTLGGEYREPRQHEANVIRKALKISGRMTPQYS